MKLELAHSKFDLLWLYEDFSKCLKFMLIFLAAFSQKTSNVKCKKSLNIWTLYVNVILYM